MRIPWRNPPRLHLGSAPFAAAARGRRLVKKTEEPLSPLTPKQRLLILDTWQCSGLPAGDFASCIGAFTVARKRKRKRPRRPPLPELPVAQILAWADLWHDACGRWPKRSSGRIPGSLGLNWRMVDNALLYGFRGLPGGSSLAQLLQGQRGVRNIRRLPSLSIDQLLAWADAHRARTGAWPSEDSGAIPEAPGEIWSNVATSLRDGTRGFVGGQTLAQLLAEYRGTRNLKQLPALTEAQILAWADDYFAQTGRWPNAHSGAVALAPGETWSAITTALARGQRGLRGGSRLAQLLAEHRGVPNRMRRPRLTEKQILDWAERHFERTGTWPGGGSGPVADAPGENWRAIEAALDQGHRGLPGGTSLARLLRPLKEDRHYGRSGEGKPRDNE